MLKLHVAFLITMLCLGVSMHAMECEEQRPEHFKDLVCPAVGEHIDKEALLNSNSFWKEVSEIASQQQKDNYLEEALGQLPVRPFFHRDKIICALAAGASPNMVSKLMEDTVLVRALYWDDYYLAQFALECGADPNFRDHDSAYLYPFPLRRKPIFLAAKNVEMAQLLIKYKAAVTLQGEQTVLHHIIQNMKEQDPQEEKTKKKDLFLYYTQQGCKVNALDECDETPLMKAVQYDFNKDKFKLLLEAKADVAIKNEYDQTVFDIAREKACLEQAQEVYDEFQQECTM